MHTAIGLAASLVLALSGLPAGSAQSGSQLAGQGFLERPASLARLDAAFDELVAQGFTGTIAITRNGEPVYDRSHDSGDRTFGMDTPIDILSMTKSFTGLLAASLIEEGTLSADTPLGEIFANVPDDKAAITVHQLLTHTAGLPHSLGDDHEVLGRDAYLARAWAVPLTAEPGTGYDYSNVGYSILAAIVERLTGVSFDTALRQRILLPAGIEHTGYQSVCCENADEAARAVAGISWGGGTPSWHLIGNGGMLSTPRDLLAWVNAYETGRLGGHDVRALTHRPYQQEGDGAPTHYGYGLVVEDIPGLGRSYWHNGGSRAFNGHWRYYADQGVAIVVTSDQWEIDPDSAERALAAALFRPARD